MDPYNITMYLDPKNHQFRYLEFDGYPLDDAIAVSEFLPLWAFNLALAAKARGETDFIYNYKGYTVDVWWD